MKILILSTRKNFNFSRPQDEAMYSSWVSFNKKADIQTALGGLSFYSNGKFSEVFSWNDKGDKIIIKDYIPDLILLRVKNKLIYDHYSVLREITSKIKTINSLDFSLTFDKKSNQYMCFSSYQPKTIIVETMDQLKDFLENSNKEYILKPDIESGGTGIKIVSKTNMPESLEGLHLVQELIDNSQGIKNVIDGKHDLRFIFIGGKLEVIVLRIPSKGNFLANAHQGGTTRVIELKEIDPKISNLAIKISKFISSIWGKENIYSIDLLVEKRTNPYLVEINSMPGYSFIDKDNQYKLFTANLNLFKKIIK